MRENRSLHATRLFQCSLHPSRGPGTSKKFYFIKSTIYARWYAHSLNAAVERRRAGRQPLIPYRPAPVCGSSENRRDMSLSAPVRDRVRERMDENLPGEFVTFS